MESAVNLPYPVRFNLRLTAIIVVATLSLCPARAQVDVLTQHNDRTRAGVNLHETILTPANVDKAHFGMLFKRVVDDQVYSQPLVATGVPVGGQPRDLVVITTVNNSVYAFDAGDAQARNPVWHVNFGTPATVHSAPFTCTDINGNMGIIGTPVIDPAKRALYVVALIANGDAFTQQLHALDLATGAELPHSPVIIDAPDFNPLYQNQRPALLLANGNVYIGYSSHCDYGRYHGFLFAYDAATLSQTAVLNTSPTGGEASIWQSGQGPAADADGNLYVVTGNGSWDGVRNFSDSFLKLSPDLKLLDWFTPTNHFELDKHDMDLNSSGAVLLPGLHTVLGGGKEGVVYLLDTANLGHLGDEKAVQHFQATASHIHSTVYWKSDRAGGLLYLWGQHDRLRAYRLEQTAAGPQFGVKPFETRAEVNHGHPGAMLSLSANGGKDGILWASVLTTGDALHKTQPGSLDAYDASDIRHALWNSLEVPKRDDCGNFSKMAPPTIANGKVYLASFGPESVGTGQLCVYGLLPSESSAKATLPAPPTQSSGKPGPGKTVLDDLQNKMRP